MNIKTGLSLSFSGEQLSCNSMAYFCTEIINFWKKLILKVK